VFILPPWICPPFDDLLSARMFVSAPPRNHL
jgi:hypothetical protein